MLLETTTQFRKDYKRIKKRGYNLELLKKVLDTLMDEKPLDAKHRDHALIGEYTGVRECHIQPDWLLIYRISQDRMILVASRTGTHSDLFDE